MTAKLEPVYGVWLQLDSLGDKNYRPTQREEATLTRMLFELFPSPTSPYIAQLLLHLTSPIYREQRNVEVWRAILKVFARFLQDSK